MFTIDFSLQFHLKSKIPPRQWECGVNVFIAGITRIKHLDITSKEKKKNITIILIFPNQNFLEKFISLEKLKFYYLG